MRNSRKHLVSEVVFLMLASTASLLGATYYIDCENGNDANAGTAASSAWLTLEKVNNTTFSAGDRIALRRGKACSGMLSPKGSGEEDSPILLGAYGDGPLPLVAAGDNEAAIKLFNQEHWEIENIETTGGSPYGILIGGDRSGILRHFAIRNVVVHDVTGEVTTKRSGLIAVIAGHPELRLEDIVVEGVTAYSTTQWSGIIVNGGSKETRAKNVVIKDSIVHDVYGDGIVMFQVEDGVIETSAAWLTGLQPRETIGTPNGIWTWRCRSCSVQVTEGFYVDSPGVDGGVYDIDWGNENNIVQYNFGHDAMGYCMSVFGANEETTANSILRYNVCVNNGRSPKLARRQGDLYISTWDGGDLDGVQIYNNTFYWNPPIDVAVVNAIGVNFRDGGRNIFANNLLYSTVPSMTDSTAALEHEANLYWYEGQEQPTWILDGAEYRGCDEYRREAGKGEFCADPQLTATLRLSAGSPAIDRGASLSNRGQHDVYDEPIPAGEAIDVGAAEYVARSPIVPQIAELQNDRFRSRWTLLSFLDPASADSRGQLVFLQSARRQYGEKGLDVVVSFPATVAEPENLKYDWNLDGIGVVSAPGIAVDRWPTTVLISPTSRPVRWWEGFVMPVDLGLTLRNQIGPPTGTPAVPFALEH